MPSAESDGKLFGMVVDFNPDIFSIGPLHVRWYGMMYVVGFVLANYLLRKLIDRGFFHVTKDKVDTLITTVFVCMFLGARLFYVFIYNWEYYQNNLSELFSVWKGGLSFHGALVGLLVGGFLFAKRYRISWAQVMDNIALAGAPGLFFGRMGNFINGELYGRVTDSPLGMIFPSGGPYPRHPSQLYEGVLEGLVLASILWLLLPRVKKYGILASVFLMGYGTFRYIVEFFREPDAQLGYYFGGTTTMGQILCFIMILIGVVSLIISKKSNFN